MKKILVLILTVMLACSFSACGKENKENNDWTASEKTEKVPSKSDWLDKVKGEQETAQETEDKEQPEEEAEIKTYQKLQTLVATDFLEEWVSETGRCLVTWDSIILSEEDAARFPNLAAALDRRNENCKISAQNMLGDLVPAAQESAAFYSSLYYVQRADEKVLSFLDRGYLYESGGETHYMPVGVTLDTKTGEYLYLEDVWADPDVLPELLASKLQENYPQEDFSDLAEYLDVYEPADYLWTLGYEGITFYFSSASLYVEMEGILGATLSFAEYEEYFVKEFVTDPHQEYAVALPVAVEMGYGEGNTISLQLFPDEYGYYEYVVLSRNGVYYADDANYGYEFRPYLVHTYDDGEDRYFVYLETVAENDYNIFSVYDLNGEGVDLVEQMPGTGFTGEWHEDEGEYGTYYQNILSNPAEFALESRIEVLGTNMGRKSYHINPVTGEAIAQEEEYTLTYEVEVTTTIPIEVLAHPMLSWEELPEGTVVYPAATDGASYVDVELEDGRKCRIEVDMSEWPRRINGIPEEECFDGILYAG